MSRIVFKAISDVGCRRSNNEDMALAGGKLLRDAAGNGELEFGKNTHAAFAVADGMGGYAGGEIASEIALRALDEYIRTMPGGLDEAGLILSLKNWAKQTNRLLLATAAANPRLAEMGTTLVALVCYEGKMATVNIGDSRLYRYRHGVLKQLTTDHSERELKNDPEIPSHLIYNFLGNDGPFFADVTFRDGQVFAGDVFLLCSDGLSDMLTEETISTILEKETLPAEQLVKEAKEAGGKDNITIIMLHITHVPEETDNRQS